MSLLDYRPTVFISSSIAGMETIREEVRAAVASLGFAQAWIFEVHAAAAGAPAEAQYLAKAKASDVFVLLIGSHVSEATWREYEVAYEDNPLKIAPFLVGSDNDADKSKVIRGRHTYKRVSELRALPSLVADAVSEFVGSGTIVIRALDEALRGRLEEARSLAAIPVAIAAQVKVTGDGTVSSPEIGRASSRLLLTGPAGAGKSDAGLRALMERQDRHLIPIYARFSLDTPSVSDCIRAAMRSAHFKASREIVDDWAGDGRLLIAFDGMDQLPDQARGAAYESIERFASEFPRVGLIVLARAVAPTTLPSFQRAQVAPLSDDDVVAVLTSAGHRIRRVWDVPHRFIELVRRPLWAGLLANVGPEAASALELIGETVDRRLALALPEQPIARLAVREALEVLAVADQAAGATTVDAALSRLAAWLVEPGPRTRHSDVAADWMLDECGRSGLIGIEGRTVAYAHPLFSAYLAADALAKGTTKVPIETLSQDASVFASVSVPESRSELVADLLAHLDVFGLASVARLSVPLPRTSNLADDLSRFDGALTKLSSAAGKSRASEIVATKTSVGRFGDVVAFRRLPPELSGITDATDLTEWARPQVAQADYVCWTSSPFLEHAPERLAASEVVAAFKSAVLASRPPGSEFGGFGVDTNALLADLDALAVRLLRDAHTKQEFRLRVLDELNLTSHLLGVRSVGNPRITVWIVPGTTPTFSVEWGEWKESVEFRDSDKDQHGRWLTSVEADAEPAAWADLSREIEDLLESSLLSQAQARPTLLPSWTI